MTANKYQKIREAVCCEPEIAALARKHNDANILCLPARYLSEKTACNITFNFLQTVFEGGRHKGALKKSLLVYQEYVNNEKDHRQTFRIKYNSHHAPTPILDFELCYKPSHLNAPFICCKGLAVRYLQ